MDRLVAPNVRDTLRHEYRSLQDIQEGTVPRTLGGHARVYSIWPVVVAYKRVRLSIMVS